jgi:hypothetical protein
MNAMHTSVSSLFLASHPGMLHLSSAESIDLTKFAAWIQIHKLPIGYRDHDLIKNPTKKKMGKVFSMETEF